VSAAQGFLAGAHDRLVLCDELRAEPATMERRGHRAVGVVYDPETQALHALHVEPDLRQPPETYPFGL
jgi:hypothetical protein